MELKASIRILIIYFLLFLFLSSAITVVESSNVVLRTKKKIIWSGNTDQKGSLVSLPPPMHVPSPPSSITRTPPKAQ
ncbi:hypothetical protein ACJW31_12G091900 [Castanea mollissima]